MTTSQNPTRNYRSDIDGLRALAVLLVVFNHVGFRHFSGGYVGVDVFFVISGYLISGHILQEIRGEGFSLARFYERRFRRIVPALAAVLLAASVAAYVFLFPAETKSFAQSELGAIFSVSNIVLLHQTTYFDPIRKLKPLLHTWSLGVEEQFYIVFPLFMMVLMRWARRWLRVTLWTLTICLFYFADHYTQLNASRAFFLSPVRAWELLCGVLLAAEGLPRLEGATARNLASFFGVFLVLRANSLYDDATVFPGMSALAPCLGAVLILAAGETGTSVVGSVLSWAPIRWIGLISYSLYLWHWPIQVFQQTNNILVPDRAPMWVSQVAIVVASIVAAAVSWKFIEQPFRTGVFRGARTPLFLINGGLLAVLTVFAAFMVAHNGWPPPWAPKLQTIRDTEAASASIDQMRWGSCYVGPDEVGGFKSSVCLAEDPARRHFLIAGDSHSAHAYWGFKKAFPEFNFSQFSITGCIPTISQSPWAQGLCGGASHYLYADYLSEHKVDTVVLIARWRDWDLDYLGETTKWIEEHGMKVVIVGPSIEYDASLLRLLELTHREHDPNLLGRHRTAEPEKLDRRMQALSRDVWHVPYISIFDDLCGAQAFVKNESASGCPAYADSGVPLLWDTDHFSPDGAIDFAKAVRLRNQLP